MATNTFRTYFFVPIHNTLKIYPHAARTRFATSCLLVIMFGLSGLQTEAKSAKMLDIADTVATNRILTQLAAEMQSSGLIIFLSSRGPFTLFAPTDAAFSKLPPGMLDSLLRPENKERLQDILLFNIVNGKSLTAKDLSPLASLPSCEGNALEIKQTRSGVQMVLKARVVQSDIRCLNGIIDEIDTVLMPPESSMPPLVPIPPPSASMPIKTNAPLGSTPQTLGSMD